MKKLNKFFAVLVALAMMAVMCVTAAFALETDDGVPYGLPTTGENQAVLNKYLVVPEGANVPGVRNVFEFNVYADGLVGVTAAEAEAAKPNDVTIELDKDSAKTADPNDGNSVYGYAPINLPNNLQHPGVYAYIVTEKTSDITDTDKDGKVIDQDGATYIIYFRVANDENGQPKVQDITVQDTTEDEDGKVTPTGKKDPTVQDPTGTLEDIDNDDATPDEFVAATDSGASFKNTLKVTAGDGTLPNSPLKVSKAVKGDGAPADASFPFSITVHKALGADDKALTAKIYSKDGDVVSEVKDINYETAKTFNLKANETLAFDSVPVGTTWEVKETLNNAAAYSAYAPSAVVTNNGDTLDARKADLGQTLAAQNAGDTYLLYEGKKDSAAYTNEYKKDVVSPTGILISNLPYIALALVAVGGLVAYVVVRRKADDEA